MATKAYLIGLTTLLAFSACLTAGAQSSLCTQLLDYWTFNEGCGTVAHDWAQRYDGTLENFQFDKTDGWRPGQVGKASLQFDGMDDYVSLGSKYALPECASISAWVQLRPNLSASPDMSPVAKPFYILSNFSPNVSTTTYIDGDGSVWLTDRDLTHKDDLHTAANVVAADGKWHNIVFVRGGWLQSIYVDGIKRASSATAIISYPHALGEGYIGMGYQYIPGTMMPIIPRYANGLIDDVRVYNRWLTDGSAAMDAAAGGEIAQLAAFAPLRGDANGDGVVNFDDYLVLESSFGGPTDLAAGNADFDGNGVVNFDDYLVIESSFGTGAAVPEPATLAMLGLGLVGMIRRISPRGHRERRV